MPPEQLTIGTCSKCGNSNIPTKKYGDYFFCLICAKDINEKYGRPKSKLDFKVEPGMYGADGRYSPSMIVLKRLSSYSRLIIILSHETLHYVIHKIAGVQACYNWDFYGHQINLDSLARDGCEPDEF